MCSALSTFSCSSPINWSKQVAHIERSISLVTSGTASLCGWEISPQYFLVSIAGFSDSSSPQKWGYVVLDTCNTKQTKLNNNDVNIFFLLIYCNRNYLFKNMKLPCTTKMLVKHFNFNFRKRFEFWITNTRD